MDAMVPGETDGQVGPRGPEGGNTKTPSGRKKQAPAWFKCCFVLNNYTAEDIIAFESSSRSKIPTMAFQEEDGRSKEEPDKRGTPHLQGFCVFAPKKKYRPIGLFKKYLKHTRTHFEKMKGTVPENVAYCTDIHKRIDDGHVYMRGCPKPTVLMTREIARPIQLEIANKYIKDEDPLFGRELHWYYEEKGQWGKSKTATYMIDQMGATELDGGKKDMLFGLRQLIEEHGQCPPIIIVDIPRASDVRYVSWAGLEKIKDGKFFSPKYESGMCRFNSPHIIIFSNFPPPWERMSEDRWKVFNVDKSVQIPIKQEDTWN